MFDMSSQSEVSAGAHPHVGLLAQNAGTAQSVHDGGSEHRWRRCSPYRYSHSTEHGASLSCISTINYTFEKAPLLL